MADLAVTYNNKIGYYDEFVSCCAKTLHDMIEDPKEKKSIECSCLKGALEDYFWKKDYQRYLSKEFYSDTLTSRLRCTSRVVVLIKSLVPPSAVRIVVDGLTKIINDMRSYTKLIMVCESTFCLDTYLFPYFELHSHYQRLARSVANKVNGVINGKMKGFKLRQLDRNSANVLASKIYSNMWRFSRYRIKAFWLSEGAKRKFIDIMTAELFRMCNAILSHPI